MSANTPISPDNTNVFTIALAAAPIGLLCSVGEKECTESGYRFFAGCMRFISIVLSPLDAVIQVVVGTVWCIFDIARKANCWEWIFSPILLPLTFAAAVTAAAITASVYMIKKATFDWVYDGREMHHILSSRANWLMNSNVKGGGYGVNAQYSDETVKVCEFLINAFIKRKLHDAGYRSLMVINRTQPGKAPTHYGSSTRFYLVLDPSEKTFSDGDANETQKVAQELKEHWNLSSDLKPQQIEYLTCAELDTLANFNYLPLRLMDKLNPSPRLNGVWFTSGDTLLPQT